MKVRVAAGLSLTTVLGLCAPAIAQTTSSLVGSWTETVYLASDTPFAITTAGLVTFNSDETVTDTTAVDLANSFISTPGHGIWQSSSALSAAIKVDRVLVDNTNEDRVADVLTGTVTLTGPNTFTASGKVVIYTASGQVNSTVPFTAVGERITLP